MRTNNWFITINNYTDEEIEKLRELDFKYLVIGFETGKEKETDHLHAAVILKIRKRWETMKRILPRAHLETIRNMEKTITYCKKEEKFEEFGELPILKPGKRTDLDEIREAILEGERLSSVAVECKNFQQIKYAENLSKYVEKERHWKTKIIWLTGESGCGKSRYMEEKSIKYKKQGKSVYWKPDSTKWWNGYDEHEIVMFDEVLIDDYGLKQFLRLTDRYPLQVETKGGYKHFLAKKIYLTSVYPQHLNNDEVKRRIDKILKLDMDVDGRSVKGNTK